MVAPTSRAADRDPGLDLAPPPAAEPGFATDHANVVGKLICIGVLALLALSQYRQRVTPFNPGEVAGIMGLLALHAAVLWDVDRWILQRIFSGRIPRLRGIAAMVGAGALMSVAITYLYLTLFSAVTVELFAQHRFLVWMRVLLVNVFPICGLLCLEYFYRQKLAVTHNEALRRENLEARYRLLEQQLNPHFLFNSLSVLHTMVREQNPHAPDFILRLTGLYRRILANREQVLASLGDELDFVTAYLAMLQERFEGKLRPAIDVPEAFRGLKLPTFSLYVLVENCAKHNIISASAPLTIRIGVTERGEVRVSNNHQPRQHPVDGPSGLGLANLRNRYRLLGKPDGVATTREGGEFAVTLPLLE